MYIRHLFLENNPRQQGGFYRKSYRFIDLPSFDVNSMQKHPEGCEHSTGWGNACHGSVCLWKNNLLSTLQVVTWNFMGELSWGWGEGGCQVKLCSFSFLDNSKVDAKMYAWICLPFLCYGWLNRRWYIWGPGTSKALFWSKSLNIGKSLLFKFSFWAQEVFYQGFSLLCIIWNNPNSHFKKQHLCRI